MKNKSLTKITALVLLVTMITLVIISGTLAKYTSEYDGAGTAIVAKWDVTVTDLDDVELSESATFDLFDATKVYDLDGVTDFTTETVTDDADVYNGTDKAIVAPGKWGKVGFKVKIGADNDVTVKYGIDITKLETDLPLQFSVDGTTWKTADEIKTELASGAYSITEKTVQPRATASENTVILYWKWDYEVGSDATTIANNDKTDTALGKEGTKTCVIEAKLGATQVD